MGTTYTSRIEKSGRILIPAVIRHRLGLREGSEVIVRVEASGQLQVTSRAQALARVQGELRKYVQQERSLADELIAERRAEAERENAG
ncbi:MAG: AbrB/MazE/SpoVT family DNA-binding domain-containing protein [Bryobacteraceae bacterium]|jgi:AbrB family looped-hinge helix DNA binding protein